MNLIFHQRQRLTRAKRRPAVIAAMVVAVMGTASWCPAVTKLELVEIQPPRVVAAGVSEIPSQGGCSPEAWQPVPDTDCWGQRPEQLENPHVRGSAGLLRSTPATASVASIPRFHVTVRPAEQFLASEADRLGVGFEPIRLGAGEAAGPDSTASALPIQFARNPTLGNIHGGEVPSTQFGEIMPGMAAALAHIPDAIPAVDSQGFAATASPARLGQGLGGTAAVADAPVRLAAIQHQGDGVSCVPAGPQAASLATAPLGAEKRSGNDLAYASFGLPNTCENAGYDPRAFIPNPDYACQPYDPCPELGVYRGKFCVPAQGPWVELGRGLYRQGPLPPAATFLTGETNPIIPHFLIFGDFRTALAYNDNGNGNEAAVWANRLNLDFDWKITSTERIHAFWGPIDRGGNVTRSEFREDNIEFFPELDNNLDTLFFEGDLGYVWGGMTDRWAPFDLPVTAGRYPLLFQNGTWLLDVLDGFAFNFPGKNSPVLDWSNYEVTFFFALNNVTSPAFVNNSNVDLYGVQSFIEAYNGYLEVGYAYLNDQSGQGFSYHNLGVSFTRRYFQRVSTSFRAIFNAGQDPAVGPQTADGQLLLWENALVTRAPNYFVPYVNLFLGLDRPQSVARAAGTGGVLFNTGINFETDFLTNYPTLDATANNSWGGACGVNLLGPDFSWQLITELAMVKGFGPGGVPAAVGDQYALGTRFQVPLNNAWLWRVDGIYGIRSEQDDIRGARTELRWKF